MSKLLLPHRLDLYTAGTEGSGTPIQANVAGYVEAPTADARIRLQSVSQNEVALLWLDIAAKNVLADKMVIYWRDRATWWTVRGTPQIFEARGAAHIEVTIAANATDGFFPAAFEPG